jgi:hypothetical protein
MDRDWNTIGSDGRPNGRGVPARLAVVVSLFLMAEAVAAQDAQPQPDPQAQPQAAPPQGAPQQPPAFQPGFLDALGRWIGDSKSKIDEQFKSTTDAAKDAAGAAGQATGVILGLPGTRVVLGRERCPVAPNGGADCAPAANALCRSKGFGAGRGFDISSAQKCPAWVWLSGRPPPDGICTTETFVSRAVCQ